MFLNWLLFSISKAGTQTHLETHLGAGYPTDSGHGQCGTSCPTNPMKQRPNIHHTTATSIQRLPIGWNLWLAVVRCRTQNCSHSWTCTDDRWQGTKNLEQKQLHKQKLEMTAKCCERWPPCQATAKYKNPALSTLKPVPPLSLFSFPCAVEGSDWIIWMSDISTPEMPIALYINMYIRSNLLQWPFILLFFDPRARLRTYLVMPM